MKVKYYSLLVALLVFKMNFAQLQVVKGFVKDAKDNLPLAGVTVSLEGSFNEVTTDKNGFFELNNIPAGEYILLLALESYQLKSLPIIKIPGKILDLNELYLENDLVLGQTNQIISLTTDDLFEEGGSDGNYALLQASRDVFLNRAAFDFSQAFFRLRGYDWKEGSVALNGIEMNKIFNGRAQWNNWGGLNDVTRDQDYTLGLAASNLGFGGILGLTNINLRPSLFRPGLRVSSSLSNRTYAGRLMTTFNSGVRTNGFSYSVSASRRWAGEGYLEGTLYDSYAGFLALDYHFNKKHSLVLTGILSSNRRGQSAPITQEVFNLVGRRYNPNWGIQNGDIRNSRTRIIREPIVLVNYFYEDEELKINLGASYQFGTFARNRLSYFDAPNPDPVYYRYLPSYYINQRTPNFENAALAREGFKADPQINWEALYTANQSELLEGRSAYLVQKDHTDDKQLNFTAIANYKLNSRFKIDLGFNYKVYNSANYAEIDDLLGSSFHEDIDTFSGTRNDVNGSLTKGEGTIFGYNYKVNANILNCFTQFGYASKKWDAFITGKWDMSVYTRNGLFLNERFPENSLGKSTEVRFTNPGFKAGVTYRWNGRHIFSGNLAYIMRSPLMQNIFINPRENNEVVPDLSSEKIKTAEFNYFLRWKDIKGRATLYYSLISDVTDINFFYVESGVGNDFVQEVLTNTAHKHMGMEIGVEHSFSPNVKLTAVLAYGDHRYAENGNLTINFDPSGDDEEAINNLGKLDLGTAAIRNYRLPTGPQVVVAGGMEYRSPKYWWLGITANFLTNNYTDIAKITRTPSFLIDPETNTTFPEATEEAVSKLLKQEKLEDIYLLNVTGGKSWLIKDTYISAFISINNLFDLTYRTGGYEQSRNGNFGSLQTDNARGNPSFGPKHWYGPGRTYFLNLAINFK